ncbi:E3 ubiquitin-protein ligase FANCL [Anopheles marshallii]|uniref:E3 ubiquitin-protein ligase FANCL n=1 Tax=Anopheles marshallii TaxID=1521116 RepID=UPI00237BB496|nr:E3 ubiquitin-protein ligase FANCL [Anopheles marshallii]
MNEFLQNFPFLVQLQPYHFVGLYKKVYKIKLYLPNYPTTTGHRVTVFRGNHPISLPPDHSSILQVDKFVHNLLAMLDSTNALPNGTSAVSFEDTTVLTNLALALLAIQHQYRCKVAFNKTLMHVEFTELESSGKHSLSIDRIGGELFKVAQHTLPELAVCEIFKRQTTLQRHLQVFLDTLEQLEEFYNNLSTIDELCYVILPATIDTKTTCRIFKYDQKTFLKISLHPLQPAAVDIAFFGPTKQVAKLREIYDEKQDDWNPECNVYTNLVRIFNIIAFPMRPSGDQSLGLPSSEESCGICMNYHDAEDRVPIISCDNEQCHLIFHIHCLKEWFSAQRESKKIFTISIGNCPYCTHKISSSFDEILEMLK